jgi:uncharacterized protein (DUF362 family)/Pyruvate/2-oxoacid:ferredoxin oxidoreductase delta subunit
MNQVVLAGCKTYDYQLIKDALAKNIEALGGLAAYFKPGQRIMLKANLLMKKRPEEATTTHPIFMKALADTLTEFGLWVLVADSPGGPFSEVRLKSLYAYCGYNILEENPSVKLNYNVESLDILTPNGKYLKRMSIMKALDEVDHVISVSKLKTHGMMRYTGAVKNMFGIIPGVQKAEYHFTLPKLEDFADGLIDICMARPPVLSFMDGIIAMEGHGPSAGEPKAVGVVITSQSPFYLDLVACQIIGLSVADVPMLKQAVERGYIHTAGGHYEVLGESIDQFIQKDFEIPKVRGIGFFDKSPKFMKAVFEKHLKPNPIFDHGVCVGCSDCADNCPPKAIAMKNKRPYVELDVCIRCFCCQELCPVKAVKIKRSWILDKIVKM